MQSVQVAMLLRVSATVSVFVLTFCFLSADSRSCRLQAAGLDMAVLQGGGSERSSSGDLWIRHQTVLTQLLPQVTWDETRRRGWNQNTLCNMTNCQKWEHMGLNTGGLNKAQVKDMRGITGGRRGTEGAVLRRENLQNKTGNNKLQQLRTSGLSKFRTLKD